jgi:hypothetical protein
MVYVGIDFHRNRSQIAVLDRDGGEILSRRIVNEPETFLELLQGLGDDVQVALRRTSRRASSAICATCFATGWRSRGSAPR